MSTEEPSEEKIQLATFDEKKKDPIRANKAYPVWRRTSRPRVERGSNICLVFMVALSLFSYMSVFIGAAVNLILNIVFAIYSASLQLKLSEALIFNFAALWMGEKFLEVILILLQDMIRLIGLAWGSKHDERLPEFMWETLKDHQDLDESGIQEKNFEGWIYSSFRKEAKVDICCFKVIPGNVYRILYSIFVVLLMPILAMGYMLDYNDGHMGPTILTHSFCMSLLFVAFLILTLGWLHDYYVLLKALKKCVKDDAIASYEEENAGIRESERLKRSTICCAIIKWFFWTNNYIDNCYCWYKKWPCKVCVLLFDLILCPLYITWIFYRGRVSMMALFVCIMLPWVHYMLRTIKSFRLQLIKKNRTARNENNVICCCDRNLKGRCVKKNLIRHKTKACTLVLLLLGAVSVAKIAFLYFTATPDLFPLTATTGFPICNVNFAFGEDILGPTEMTLLAELSYKDQNVANQTLRYFFGNENIVYNNINGTDSGANFYHVKATKLTRGHSENVAQHFVVIRGTTVRVRDALQDFSLWSEISSFQMINLIIPLLRVWPITFTCDLVDMLSNIQGWIGSKFELESYFHDVFNYVEDFLPPWQDYVNNSLPINEKVMMIGHSLGGGLANLVASKEYGQYADLKVPPRVKSFGVSPVGTVYSSKKFGFPWYLVGDTETSVWSERDIIPLVDRHMGLQQVIPCVQNNFVQCHAILNTLCELWRQCSLPSSALNQDDKENFLNCVCCQKKSRVQYCVDSVIHDGAKWNRSCASTVSD